MSALVALKQGDICRATAEVDVLRHSYAEKKNDRQLENRLWEVQGMLLCKTGSPDEGLKLLQRAVDKTKADYGHHAWGNGAYYMEQWGAAALECGKLAVAEEAFLEALAHDPGSVRAALGLQSLCQRQQRTEEVARYEALAKKCWKKADIDQFISLREEVLKAIPATTEASVKTGGGT